MFAEVVIGPDGSVIVAVQEGSYEDAKGRLEALLAKLKAQGFDVSEARIERHRHEGQGIRVEVEVKA